MQLEASMHQGIEQQMPSFNLPSKILCKVVNVQLRVIYVIHILLSHNEYFNFLAVVGFF